MKQNKRVHEYDYEAMFSNNVEELHGCVLEELLRDNKKYKYALKEIISGQQLEVEIYPEFKNKGDIQDKREDKHQKNTAQSNLNDKNSRKYVERLLNTNFSNKDIWITLTYSKGEEPATMGEAIKNVRNYIRRINYQRKKKGLPKAKYIYITEHSPIAKIRWHHHIVMDGAMSMDLVEQIWTKGRRNEVRRLEEDEYGFTGISQYITKEKNREKNEKRWNASTGLKQFKVRKVYSKPIKKNTRQYKAIEGYVNGFVRDRDKIELQMKEWYAEYCFTECQVFYNDFNGMFYVKVRMRRYCKCKK